MTTKDDTSANALKKLTNLDDFILCTGSVSALLDYLLDRKFDYLLDKEKGNILPILKVAKSQSIASQKIANSIYHTEIRKLKIL